MYYFLDFERVDCRRVRNIERNTLGTTVDNFKIIKLKLYKHYFNQVIISHLHVI